MFHLLKFSFSCLLLESNYLPFNCSSLSVVSKGVGLFSTSNIFKSDYANNGALSPLIFQIYQSTSQSVSVTVGSFSLQLFAIFWYFQATGSFPFQLFKSYFDSGNEVAFPSTSQVLFLSLIHISEPTRHA